MAHGEKFDYHRHGMFNQNFKKLKRKKERKKIRRKRRPTVLFASHIL